MSAYNNSQKLCNFCQKPALHKCAACYCVFYCTKQHQKEDWKQHKTVCRPFKICENATIGRYLIATRPLKPGDLILSEPPLIWGPSSNTAPVCLGCGKGINENSSRPCNKCGWPVCGELCEKSPSHLPECRYTSQRGEKITIKNFEIQHPIYRCITVLRCLYQKQFLPKIWKKLETLEAHYESRKCLSTYETERVTVAEFIKRFFRLFSFTEEDIMRVYGILMVNSHEVPLTEPAHIAVYGTTSMLEHDCSANCSKSFTSKGHVIITAAKPINEGDHLSICYTDPLWGTPNRRYFLHETKYFWCHCARCEDPTEFGTNFSALKCQNLVCDGYLLPPTFTEEKLLPDWVCNKCGRNMSSYSVHDILERIGRDLYDLDKNDIQALKNFIANYTFYLPKNHFYYTDVAYTLSHLLGQAGVENLTDDDLSLKLQCCQNLESLLKVIAPAEKRVLGTVLFEMHAATAELARRNVQMASDFFEESRRILKEAIFLLKDEPEVLPEGKILRQAMKNLKDMDAILIKSAEPIG